MIINFRQWYKKTSLGISLKLFLAFWLVIISSVLASYLVTIQLKHKPTQELVDLKQLELLTDFIQKTPKAKAIKFQTLQFRFNQHYKQNLIVKNLSNKKVYLPRKRAWAEVRDYLRTHSLDNPVTIDFGFTQVTPSQPVTMNGQQFQFFIASQKQPNVIMNLINQLPYGIRLIFLLAISFLLCWLLAKSFSNPLIAIKRASEDIGQGKLATRIEKFDQRSDEFGSLARSFNKMAEQLENNITTHQRLLADVSHELRSPLTRLQLAVALAEKNMGNTLEQQKHLWRCETEVDRLDEMIADVLTLSRLEHSHNAFAAANIELTPLVDSVINDCQYFANSKDVTITRKGEMTCKIFADAKLLESAISNVVNNAVKYSPENKKVIVALSENKKHIQFTISDQGPGVPEEMITHLFSPFFRVADGRERSTGGTGLGLAIAQQAITLHKGDIIAQNAKEGGFIVTITLPKVS